MSDWQDGYVAGLPYTHGYYQALNPTRVRFAMLSSGYVPPANLTACELGYGQGVSANVHAAASTTQWFGTDFLASQAGYASALAAASGAGARFFDQSFSEFCARPDLPDFDFIGLHGIWSWISDADRSVIRDFVRRKLKVGGVVYLSYNALPGSAAMVPLRDVLIRFVDSMLAPGQGLEWRVDRALDFAQEVLARSPLFVQANPQIATRLAAIRTLGAPYLAHEYLNRNWAPMAFSQMRDWLSPAKLEYACSANYFTTVDALNLSAEQQVFLGDIPDAMLRETVRDLMVNRVFRGDYWVKGARALSPPERAEALRAEPVMLTKHRGFLDLKVKGALHEILLPPAICDPILDVLSDHRPKTLGEIEQAAARRGVEFSQVMELILALNEAGSLAAVQGDAVTRSARPQTDRLNKVLCKNACSSNDTSVLASPVVGGGIWVDRLHQFFLHAMNGGKERPADIAECVVPICEQAGVTVMDGDRPMEFSDDHQRLQGIATQAALFLQRELPVLKALQVA